MNFFIFFAAEIYWNIRTYWWNRAPL